MDEAKLIDVGRDFSPTPGGRYRREGEWSGEQFREDVLEPALQDGGEVIVDMDGVEGFTTSFLDEVFGELVRRYGVVVMDRVHLRAIKVPSRARRALEIVEQASQEKKGPHDAATSQTSRGSGGRS
ncbi:MAG TPA: STAS-like domain-containing protein [Polyangiaceae bacterium]|jgi:hypothetical protein